MRRKAQQITSEHIHPEVKGREAFLLPEFVDASQVGTQPVRVPSDNVVIVPSSGTVKKEISYWRDRLTFSDLSESFRLAIQQQQKM